MIMAWVSEQVVVILSCTQRVPCMLHVALISKVIFDALSVIWLNIARAYICSGYSQ